MSERRGFVLILSAPSGAGKSTLARRLLAKLDGVQLSVSTTTRSPRPGEEEGKDYFFVARDDFPAMIQEKAFLEWAEVFGNYYGTSRHVVESALRRGGVILLDIDWQGAEQVRRSMPDGDVVSVFILPPDREQLRQRLELRGQDGPEVIERRMLKAVGEISHWQEYDYVIINENLDSAEADLFTIVRAERLRRARLPQQGVAILQGFGLSVS